MNTTALPWAIITCIAAAFIAASVQEWFAGQYEVARKGFRLTVTRRWYGTSAHICLRSGGRCPENPDRFQVLARDGEHWEVPRLLVLNVDFAGYEEYGPPQPFWAPVTDFAPYTVRRLRPHILRSERYRWPMLFDYRPLRQPAGYLGTDA